MRIIYRISAFHIYILSVFRRWLPFGFPWQNTNRRFWFATNAANIIRPFSRVEYNLLRYYLSFSLTSLLATFSLTGASFFNPLHLRGAVLLASGKPSAARRRSSFASMEAYVALESSSEIRDSRPN